MKENGKPRAAFSVLELIGERTAATVKLPGKLINNESPARALWIKRVIYKEKPAQVGGKGVFDLGKIGENS